MKKKALIIIFLSFMMISIIIDCGTSNDRPANGSVSLVWGIPTYNTDTSPLTDLAGFKVYYGTQPGIYTHSITIPDPEVTEVSITNLSIKRWHFTVTAYNTLGYESNYASPIYTNVTSL